MKIRILSIACVTTAAALLAACTTGSRNSGACEQLMRSKLAATSSDTLKVAHRAAAIRGSRVVVEGSIEHVRTASEVAATMPASAALAASAPGGIAGTRAVTAASGVEASSKKPIQPKTVSLPAAAECTFRGEDLDVFRWLAPAKFATPPDQAASEAAG
jgi:hypothetical protein